MIDWIRISRRIASDTKTLTIADALRIPVAQAVGHLVALFAAMAEEATDGKIGDQPDLVLERWAAWEGKRGVLAPLLRRLLLTPEGVVSAWERYNGAAIRKAGNDAERQRRHRERQRGSSALCHADASRDGHVTSRGDGDGDGDGDVELQERSSDGGSSGTPRVPRGQALSVPSAAPPPRTATPTPPSGATPDLPVGTRTLIALAYLGASPERVADVEMQALATLSVRGAKLERGVQVHAVDAEHLNTASLTVLAQLRQNQLRDPDKAIRVLLQVLRETWPEVNAQREAAAVKPATPLRPPGAPTRLRAILDEVAHIKT